MSDEAAKFRSRLAQKCLGARIKKIFCSCSLPKQYEICVSLLELFSFGTSCRSVETDNSTSRSRSSTENSDSVNLPVDRSQIEPVVFEA